MLDSRPRHVDNPLMISKWQRALIERLISEVNSDGAWGYLPASTGSAEPTAMACLALSAYSVEQNINDRALAWLAKIQRSDGAVPISANSDSPCWPTALSILAWVRAAGDQTDRYVPHVRKATAWLLESKGISTESSRKLFGHDSTLTGWPWVVGTHSWVEPTGYAILGLTAAGFTENPRVREARKMLLDRALPDGGWNYGNTRIIENTLRPFPEATGVALAALAGESPDSRIDAGIIYLKGELQRIRAPMSLSWGLIGLDAWDTRPEANRDWLEESASRVARGQSNTLYAALLLLAGAEVCPLTQILKGTHRDQQS